MPRSKTGNGRRHQPQEKGRRVEFGVQAFFDADLRAVRQAQESISLGHGQKDGENSGRVLRVQGRVIIHASRNVPCATRCRGGRVSGSSHQTAATRTVTAANVA
jgi:hypothetical protein